MALGATVLLGVQNIQLNRRIHEASVEGRISELYDKLTDYRLKHPEVLRLSRLWTPDCIAKVYAQENDEDRQWAIYYGYVELCISYCNATLHANQRKLLPATVYVTQYKPLVLLLLTEHYPAISQFTREGYASLTIAAFMSEMARSGRDWTCEFENLARAT